MELFNNTQELMLRLYEVLTIWVALIFAVTAWLIVIVYGLFLWSECRSLSRSTGRLIARRCLKVFANAGSGVFCETRALPGAAIPAKAGIHPVGHWKWTAEWLDSRFRGNDLPADGFRRGFDSK